VRGDDGIYHLLHGYSDKHKSILASYASVRPAATDSIEAIIEKEKELANTFQRDIRQIEDYLARKDRSE